jgi:hypothetical protein
MKTGLRGILRQYLSKSDAMAIHDGPQRAIITAEPAEYSVGQDLALDAESKLFRPRIRGRKRIRVRFRVVVMATYPSWPEKIMVELSPTPNGGIHR